MAAISDLRGWKVLAWHTVAHICPQASSPYSCYRSWAKWQWAGFLRSCSRIMIAWNSASLLLEPAWKSSFCFWALSLLACDWLAGSFIPSFLPGSMVERTERGADLLGNVAVLCHFECFLNVWRVLFFLRHCAGWRKPLVIIEFLFLSVYFI